MVVLLTSCHKDTYEEFDRTEITTTTNNSVTNYTTASGMVAGVVYNENNTAVENAIIEIGGQTTLTDEDGVFYFADADLDPQGSYIKARKDGYILGSDMIYPGPGLNRSYIQIMELSRENSFEVSNGGTIQIERGGSIDFEPNAIRSNLGSTYTGKVYVTAKRLATDDPQLGDKMPGGLVAEDNAKRTVVLGTLGMVAVELRGENGEELNLKAGSTAEVTFPIAPQDQASAPETIPLWYFDEDRGLWVEEGSATRVGNDYVGEVAHFSFWNCDAPFPLVTFCVNIFNADGTPANDVRATVCAGNLGASSGYSCAGVISGKIPKNQLLTLKLYSNSSCGEIIYEEEIGPFGDDVKLDPITLSENEKHTLSGKVICDGVPVANSLVVIRSDAFMDIIQTDDQGKFVYPTCYDGPIEIYGKNIDTEEGSLTQTVTLNDNNPAVLLTFDVCSDCTFEAEIVVDNDIPCDSISKLMVVVDGSGSYTYSWSNGMTGADIGDVTPGSYAVTILEVGTQCEKVLTATVEAEQNYLDWTYAATQVDCTTGDGGVIAVSVTNGVEPYSFEWTDPNGASIGTGASLANLDEGYYRLKITDANGCMIEGGVELESSGLNLQPDQVEFEINCDTSVITLAPGFPDNNYTYSWTGPNGFTSSMQSVTVDFEGQLSLTVTNQAGCTQVIQYFVLQDFEAPDFDYEVECEGFNRLINVIQSGFNTSIELYTPTGEAIPSQNEAFIYDVFANGGGTLSIIVTDNNNGCQSTQSLDININQTNNLEIVSTSPPTCNGCEDGNIEYKIIDNANCLTCTTDLYIKTTDGYDNVSVDNDNNQLGVGTYYIALNIDSDCVTEFQIVEF